MTERDGPDRGRPVQPRAAEQGSGPENPLGAWDGRGLDGIAERGPHGAPEVAGGAGARRLPSERTGSVAQGWLVYLLLSFVRMLLVTLGMISLVPQGLVPLGMAVFGADESTRLWFLARFMPPEWQVPVALGFAVVGALLTWIGLRLPRWLGWVFMGR